MQLTAQMLPIGQITPTDFGDIKGWQIGGFYLNGYSRNQYPTAELLQTALIGQELIPSKSGASLVVKGNFTPIVRNEAFVRSIIGKRDPAATVASVDLNALL